MNKMMILFALPLLLAACSFHPRTMLHSMMNGASPSASPATAMESASPVASSSGMMVEKTTVMLATQNSSGQSGTATLEDMNGKVQVTIMVTGEPATADEPAHIHAGACPKPGDIKFPLTNVVGGKSVTTIDTTLAALKAMGPLAVNLHESKAKITNYVACGDVTVSSNTMMH